MREFFGSLDRLLRGDFTKKEDLTAGRVQVPVRTLVLAGLLLGVVYGAFMGIYGASRPNNPSFQQLLATAIKVPMLFLLTLLVAYPSLYVFSALAQSRLRFLDSLRLMLIAIAINLAVLASFGPVTAFFTLSTDSYPFMILLNVLFFGISGLIGLSFLKKALRSVFVAAPSAEPIAVTPPEVGPSQPVMPQPRRREPAEQTKSIFTVWTFIYGIVGAQMGWVLRPFIGSPDLPFTFFRQRESNFFNAIIDTLVELMS